MKWKCWNTQKPETIHRIEADSLDDAAKSARMIDSDINGFQPIGTKGDASDGKD